jgi:hypothetical protein
MNIRILELFSLHYALVSSVAKKVGKLFLMSEVSHMICEGAILLRFVHSLLWTCSNTMSPNTLSNPIRFVKWQAFTLSTSIKERNIH